MGSRRTVTRKLVSDQKYLSKRRSHATKSAARNSSKVAQFERLLIRNKNMQKSSRPSNGVEAVSQISANILASAGITLQTDPKKTKKSFSLIKNVKANMILRNPRVNDLTIYKGLPKNSVLVSSVIKNSNDPFFKPEPQKSDFERIRTPNPAPKDLSVFVIEAYNATANNEINTLRAFQGLRAGGR